MLKIGTILLIFLGEILAIGAEIVAAKYNALSDGKFSSIFFKALPVFFLASILLLTGYMLGLRAFKNIWIVSAVSIGSIIISEPIINYLVTHQLPTTGALIGLVLGVLGIISALFF